MWGGLALFNIYLDFPRHSSLRTLCVFICVHRKATCASVSPDKSGVEMSWRFTTLPAKEKLVQKKKQLYKWSLSSCDKDLLASRGRSEIDAKPHWIVSLCSRWAGCAQIESARSSSKSPHNGWGNLSELLCFKNLHQKHITWSRWDMNKMTLGSENLRLKYRYVSMVLWLYSSIFRLMKSK